MRLSLVISSLTAGGAERVICMLANAWAARGDEIELLTTHDAGREPHYPLVEWVKVRSVDPRISGPLKQPAIVRALRAAVQEARPDAVVSFLNYTNILTLSACCGLKYPVVVSERLDPRVVDIGPAWSLLRRITYRRCAFLIAQTSTAAGLFEYLAPGRIRVIPNPVLLPVDAMLDPADRAGLPNPGPPTILAVGRLQAQKGFDLAIRALALLPAEFASWRLTILGEGPLRQELETLRDDLGLSDRVRLPGRVADPGPWMRSAGVFLLSSRSEGFPNALCEAMAAGLPVVATDCPSGPADIITPEVDGILVAPGDPAAIATGLARLIASPELRARFAAAAPRVVDRYSVNSVVAAWDRVLLEAAGVAASAGDSGGCCCAT